MIKKRILVPLVLLAALLGAAALRMAIRPPAQPQTAEKAAPRLRLVTLPADGAPNGAQASETPRQRRPDCYNILISGRDASGGGSDVNLLVRLDVGGGRIDAVSLPRDTLLHRDWPSNKLNYAYARGGTELLRGEIENLLGVPVDYCIAVDLGAFVALVDRIGGVDFDVPVDMDYDDPAQKLHIHCDKGPRHLNGREAMEVVRWRKNNDGSGYPDADLGRIRTQQAFLRAAAGQAARLGNAPALAELFFSYVKTDLSAGKLVWLAGKVLEIGEEGLRFHTLPGDGAGRYRRESVYVLDPEATLELVNEALDPYDRPIEAEELDILVP